MDATREGYASLRIAVVMALHDTVAVTSPWIGSVTDSDVTERGDEWLRQAVEAASARVNAVELKNDEGTSAEAQLDQRVASFCGLVRRGYVMSFTMLYVACQACEGRRALHAEQVKSTTYAMDGSRRCRQRTTRCFGWECVGGYATARCHASCMVSCLNHVILRRSRCCWHLVV